MGEIKMSVNFWLQSLKERDRSEDLGINETTILKSAIQKCCLGVSIAMI
jgi:hypothetical protein